MRAHRGTRQQPRRRTRWRARTVVASESGSNRSAVQGIDPAQAGPTGAGCEAGLPVPCLRFRTRRALRAQGYTSRMATATTVVVCGPSLEFCTVLRLAGPTKAPPYGNDASVLPASSGAFFVGP